MYMYMCVCVCVCVCVYIYLWYNWMLKKCIAMCSCFGENKLLLTEISGFMALHWEALWWQSSIFISPVPSGILMNYSELDGVQVRGTAGNVSVMIKCCSAATSVSWTTRHLPAQTGEEYTAVFIWCFCGWGVRYSAWRSPAELLRGSITFVSVRISVSF